MRQPGETEMPWDGYGSRVHLNDICGKDIDVLRGYPGYRDWNKITPNLLQRSVTGASRRLPCFFFLLVH